MVVNAVKSILLNHTNEQASPSHHKEASQDPELHIPATKTSQCLPQSTLEDLVPVYSALSGANRNVHLILNNAGLKYDYKGLIKAILALSDDGCISVCHPIGDDCLLTPTPLDGEEPVAPVMRHSSTEGTDNDIVDDGDFSFSRYLTTSNGACGGAAVGGGGTCGPINDTNAHVSKRMTEPRPTLGRGQAGVNDLFTVMDLCFEPMTRAETVFKSASSLAVVPAPANKLSKLATCCTARCIQSQCDSQRGAC